MVHKGVVETVLGRGGEPHFHEDGSLAGYRCGQALEQFSGTDAYILTAGGILGSAVEAARLLEADGLHIGVASFPTVKPLDEAYLAALCGRVPVLFTLEEHTIVGGFGGAVCEYVCGLTGPRPRVVRLGLNDTYCSLVGNQSYLEKHFGLDGEGVARRVRQELGMA